MFRVPTPRPFEDLLQTLSAAELAIFCIIANVPQNVGIPRNAMFFAKGSSRKTSNAVLEKLVKRHLLVKEEVSCTTNTTTLPNVAAETAVGPIYRMADNANARRVYNMVDLFFPATKKKGHSGGGGGDDDDDDKRKLLDTVRIILQVLTNIGKGRGQRRRRRNGTAVDDDDDCGDDDHDDNVDDDVDDETTATVVAIPHHSLFLHGKSMSVRMARVSACLSLVQRCWIFLLQQNRTLITRSSSTLWSRTRKATTMTAGHVVRAKWSTPRKPLALVLANATYCVLSMAGAFSAHVLHRKGIESHARNIAEQGVRLLEDMSADYYHCCHQEHHNSGSKKTQEEEEEEGLAFLHVAHRPCLSALIQCHIHQSHPEEAKECAAKMLLVLEAHRHFAAGSIFRGKKREKEIPSRNTEDEDEEKEGMSDNEEAVMLLDVASVCLAFEVSPHVIVRLGQRRLSTSPFFLLCASSLFGDGDGGGGGGGGGGGLTTTTSGQSPAEQLCTLIVQIICALVRHLPLPSAQMHVCRLGLSWIDAVPTMLATTTTAAATTTTANAVKISLFFNKEEAASAAAITVARMRLHEIQTAAFLKTLSEHCAPPSQQPCAVEAHISHHLHNRPPAETIRPGPGPTTTKREKMRGGEQQLPFSLFETQLFPF